MAYTTTPLAPAPAIGVYPEYIRAAEVTLDVAQQPVSLSGSDFIIYEDGDPLFKCTGAGFLSGDRKVIADMAGRELYAIAQRGALPGLSKTFDAKNAAGDTVLTVKQSGFRANFETSFYDAASQQMVALRLKGNIWASRAEATLEPNAAAEADDATEAEASDTACIRTAARGDDPIARIRRDVWSKEDIFLNRQRYALTVAPGVDLSLLVALCMCFDECKNEPRPHSLGL